MHFSLSHIFDENKKKQAEWNLDIFHSIFYGFWSAKMEKICKILRICEYENWNIW